MAEPGGLGAVTDGGDAPDVPAADVRRALADAGRLGPFFVLTTDPAERADPAWRPFAALCREPDLLDALVTAYARRLGTGEERVAASILFQGLAARLWSPTVVSAAAHGIVPDLSSLHYRWAPGAPVALWLAEPAGWRVDGRAAAAQALHRTVVGDLLTPLRAALGRAVRSDRLMWGNVAAALVGTRHAGRVRTGLAGPVTELVEELLGRAPLAGAGELVRPSAEPPSAERSGAERPDGERPVGEGAGQEQPDWSFVRHSCCLYYRVPPGGAMCGDCALLERTTGQRTTG